MAVLTFLLGNDERDPVQDSILHAQFQVDDSAHQVVEYVRPS